jgi:hypothetical protein
MFAEYRARYQDRFGEELTTIRNEGHELRMKVRGVEFVGRHVMGLEPTVEPGSSDLASFELNRYDSGRRELCGCTIEYDIPLPIAVGDEIREAMLHVHAELGAPADRGELDRMKLRLELSFEGKTYRGTGTSGWFEHELLEIQASLPEVTFMKCCISCAFSDYSPYGHDVFGNLDCYRGAKEAYLEVKTKRDLFTLRKQARTDEVQETYLCPEFQRRKPGTGYRG